MKDEDKHEHGPPTATHHKTQPAPVVDDGSELTIKEESIVAGVPTDKLPEEIEKKLEHEAEAANQLPRSAQMAKFETKLEHDDPGNQPS
jgi:hypothetical protein